MKNWYFFAAQPPNLLTKLHRSSAATKYRSFYPTACELTVYCTEKISTQCTHFHPMASQTVFTN